MIALTAAIVGPRTLAFTYWIVVAGFLLAAALRGDIEFRQVRPGPVAISFAAFLLYALLSAFWAIQPEVALTKASMALAIAASALLIWSMLINETRANLLHMGEGVCIGLLLGLLYLLIELLTDQSIKLWLYRAIRLGPEDLNPRSFFKWDGRSLMAISKDDVTRSIAPAVLFLWPTLMIIRGAWPTPWRTAGGLFLVLLATVVVMISWHEFLEVGPGCGTWHLHAVVVIGALGGSLTACRLGVHVYGGCPGGAAGTSAASAPGIVASGLGASSHHHLEFHGRKDARISLARCRREYDLRARTRNRKRDTNPAGRNAEENPLHSFS